MKNELETLKEMRADIDAKIDKLSNPEAKVGDYWERSTGEVCLIFGYDDVHGGTVKCRSISSNSKDFAYHGICTMKRKLTTTEVQQALEKEAVKRYGELKVGDKVKGHWGDEIKTMKDQRDYYLSIDSQHIYFGINNVCLMWDGKWAEIIRTLTIDDIASKLIGLDLEDTKSELIRMKTQIIETINSL